MNTKLKFAFEKETKAQFVTKRLAMRVRQRSRPGRHTLRPQKRNAGRQDPEDTCCHYHRRITTLHIAGWRFAKMRGSRTNSLRPIRRIDPHGPGKAASSV